MLFTGSGGKNDGSMPAYIVWILVACVGGIVLVVTIVVIVVACIRCRRPNKRADSVPPHDESVTFIFIFIHQKAGSSKEQTSSIKNKRTNNQTQKEQNTVQKTHTVLQISSGYNAVCAPIGYRYEKHLTYTCQICY